MADHPLIMRESAFWPEVHTPTADQPPVMRESAVWPEVHKPTADQTPVLRESAFWPDLDKVPRIRQERQRRRWKRLRLALLGGGGLTALFVLGVLWVILRHYLQ
jgi:hypothetical protein